MKDFKKITLKNGLRILFVPRREALAASVLILVEAGSEYETKRINGLSHFLEHMMFKGTVNRPNAGQIAEELAALGAQSNAFTAQEYTGYWAKAESRKLPKILEIVSDLYLNPVFNADEIEKERGVIIQELNMYEDTPRRNVQDVFLSLLYGDQPAGWDVGGEKAIIGRLTKDDFLAYRGKRYVMPGTLVVVAGNFDEKAALADIRRSFGALPRRFAEAKVKTKELQKKPRTLLKFKDAKQSNFVLGFRAFDLFDKRRYALEVLADVLGGGMSSRLFKRVREELGAAYYVGADADLSLDHGTLSVSVGVDHEKMDIVIAAILEECARLRDEIIPQKEFQRTKDHIIGNLILGLETSDELASYYGGQEILSKEMITPKQLIKKIQAVTPEEVRDVARAIMHDRGLNFAVIGPYKKAEKFEKIVTMKNHGKANA
jgi:predicted Zn-dependent peptidase